IGVRNLPVRLDALRAEYGESTTQAALGLEVRRARHVALRRDEQERRRALPGALADLLEERLADDGLVRDHEDVRRSVPPVLTQVADDVLDGDVARRALDPLDDVAAQPAGLLALMGRDDELVHRPPERVQRVPAG